MVGDDIKTCAEAKPASEQNYENSIHKEPEISWQQVTGALAANSINFATGVGMAYSSALIPALQATNSDIQTTQEQCAWLASCVPLTVPVGAIICGFIMEHLGRLAAIQSTIIPFCLSWIIIATATNYLSVLIGRVILGTLLGVAHSASTVLVTETALKKYRGPLASTGIAFAAFGILCGYVIGALFDWRTSAWVSAVSPLMPFALVCLFTAESPVWLRSRGRIHKAEKASLYYYGDPNYVVLPIALPQTSQNNVDIERPATRRQQDDLKPSFSKQIWILLRQPSGYKPLIILNTVFFIQQLTGIYIISYYAVTFFQEAGSTIDPYIATVLIGVMRFLACGLTALLLRRCKRRVLMLLSALGMAISMALSAYSTGLVLAQHNDGSESFFPSWFPMTCVVVYILVSSFGLQIIPWTMTAEIFPQRVRGAAQSVNMTVSHLFMFGTLQAYPTMNYYLGGSVGVQYFFAGSSVVAAVIIYVFFPETHGKSLSEIEDYFAHNTIYLGHKNNGGKLNMRVK